MSYRYRRYTPRKRFAKRFYGRRYKGRFTKRYGSRYSRFKRFKRSGFFENCSSLARVVSSFSPTYGGVRKRYRGYGDYVDERGRYVKAPSFSQDQFEDLIKKRARYNLTREEQLALEEPGLWDRFTYGIGNLGRNLSKSAPYVRAGGYAIGQTARLISSVRGGGGKGSSKTSPVEGVGTGGDMPGAFEKAYKGVRDWWNKPSQDDDYKQRYGDMYDDQGAIKPEVARKLGFPSPKPMVFKRAGYRRAIQDAIDHPRIRGQGPEAMEAQPEPDVDMYHPLFAEGDPTYSAIVRPFDKADADPSFYPGITGSPMEDDDTGFGVFKPSERRQLALTPYKPPAEAEAELDDILLNTRIPSDRLADMSNSEFNEFNNARRGAMARMLKRNVPPNPYAQIWPRNRGPSQNIDSLVSILKAKPRGAKGRKPKSAWTYFDDEGNEHIDIAPINLPPRGQYPKISRVYDTPPQPPRRTYSRRHDIQAAQETAERYFARQNTLLNDEVRQFYQNQPDQYGFSPAYRRRHGM